MKVRNSLFLCGFLAVAASCSIGDDTGADIMAHSFDFNEGVHGWEPGFSDYPVGPDDSAYFELKYAYGEQPQVGRSILLSGNNHNADLFLFLKKKVSDLNPNTDYTLTFTVNLACSGAQPYNGDNGVYLKVGASGLEPKSVIEKDGHVMNIDKGNQRQGGDDMIFIGDVTVPLTSADVYYGSHTNASPKEISPAVRTNSKGELWLVVGTELANPGVTTVYYTKINVALSTSR
jgi:hypothetical protein